MRSKLTQRIVFLASILLAFSLRAANPTGSVVAIDQPDQQLPPARLPFCSYDTEKGLRTFYIYAVTQDALGFLWVGGDDGAYRYDGDRFTRFGLAEGLPSSVIEHLVADSKGRVWAGTPRGMASFDGAVFVPVKESSGLPAGTINGITTDKEGRVYVALAAGLFFSSDAVNFKPVPGWTLGQATALAVDWVTGRLVAAQNNRIGRVGADGKWTFLGVDGMPAGESVQALAIDAYGVMWARSSGGSLFQRQPTDQSFTNVSAVLPAGWAKPFLGLDRYGDLLVTTVRGVLRYKDRSWSAVGGVVEGAAQWWLYAFEDREGSLWLAGNGLYRLQGEGRWSFWTVAESLHGAGVWCVFRDSAKRLWLGNREGLCQATEIDWAIVPQTEHQYVISIVGAPDGAIWASTFSSRLIRHDPVKGSTVFYGPERGTPQGKTHCLVVDNEGILWVASDSGVFRMPLSDPSANFTLETLPSGATGTPFFGLVKDGSGGRIWAFGGEGLFCREKGVWRHFTKAEGLRDNDVYILMADRKGDLWIAYRESYGVDRFRVDGNKLELLQSMTSKEGLFVDRVYSIGEDNRGLVWVGLGAGADVLGPTGKDMYSVLRHYGKSDGFVHEDCSAMALLTDSNGDVFFGTSTGLTRYHGPTPTFESYVPPMRIISAKLGDKALINPKVVLAGTPGNTLEVRFTGLSFVNEHRLQYQVRLIGLEPEWRDTTERSARYTMLPSGAYRFEVRGRVGNGPWSEPVGLSFTIEPRIKASVEGPAPTQEVARVKKG